MWPEARRKGWSEVGAKLVGWKWLRQMCSRLGEGLVFGGLGKWGKGGRTRG